MQIQYTGCVSSIFRSISCYNWLQKSSVKCLYISRLSCFKISAFVTSRLVIVAHISRLLLRPAENATSTIVNILEDRVVFRHLAEYLVDRKVGIRSLRKIIYYLTFPLHSWCKAFLEKLIVTQPLKFMEFIGSSPCPQMPAIEPHLEPVEFKPHIYILSL